MMDCKKALTETAGDMEKAIEFLREKGLAAAAKKAGRVAAEGIVTTYISEDNKTAVVLEVNCETDRKSTRLNSSHANISYAVFCLKKKKITVLKTISCLVIICFVIS